MDRIGVDNLEAFFAKPEPGEITLDKVLISPVERVQIRHLFRGLLLQVFALGLQLLLKNHFIDFVIDVLDQTLERYHNVFKKPDEDFSWATIALQRIKAEYGDKLEGFRLPALTNTDDMDVSFIPIPTPSMEFGKTQGMASILDWYCLSHISFRLTGHSQTMCIFSLKQGCEACVQ